MTKALKLPQKPFLVHIVATILFTVVIYCYFNV